MVRTPINSPRIEISLDSLLHNLAAIRSHIPSGVGILAVIKDCAYGCGSRRIAKTLEERGKVSFFAVCLPEEAFFLRRHGIRSPILVFGSAQGTAIKRGYDANIIFTLNDIDELVAWQSAGIPVRFHCHIDTRMHRMGIQPSEVDMVAQAVQHSTMLKLEGVYTHLSNADEAGTKTVERQLGIFNEALALLKNRGIVPRHIHYANSAGLMRFDLPGCTMVRPGIALYGCKPDPSQSFSLDLKPVASLKSRIVKMQKLSPHTPISYGGRYSTAHETFIATIALGYAHGLPRALGNRGEVLIRGKRYRIAGTVTMDYIMIDAGLTPFCSVGDEVVAMGCQGTECISPDDIAIICNTIGYEVLCGLDTSLSRFYLLDGHVVARERGHIF